MEVTPPMEVKGVVDSLPPSDVYREMVYWALVAGVSIFLVLPQSVFLWERLEILETFQFPVRFLNLAALALAILAGTFFGLKEIQEARKLREYGGAVILIALIAQGLQSTPANWTTEYPAQATAGAYLQHELDSGILGTTAANEFLPNDVVLLPPPTGFLIDSLAAGGPVQRINTWAYPDTITWTLLETGPTRYSFRVDTPERVLVELYLFRYPGWKATVDGEPAILYPTGDLGFFGVLVPPGEHTVRVTYPLTVPQRAGLGLSGVAVILIAAWLWWMRGSSEAAPRKDDPLPLAVWVALGVAVIGIFALMREGIAWVKSPPGEARLASHAYAADLDSAAHLLGYDIAKIDPGAYWRVSLYWRFPPPQNDGETLNAYVHLVDENGQIIAQNDKADIAAATRDPDWRDAYHLRDVYHLHLPDGVRLPKGVRLRVGALRCAAGGECVALPVTVDGAIQPEAFIYLPE